MARKSAQLQAEIDGVAAGADLENLMGYNLKRAYMIVRNNFIEALGADGMSTRVFSPLSLIVDAPNITQSALARMMGIERSGLVAIVDELEARDYLRRAAVPGDRRVQALVPTQAGRQAYQDALKAVHANEERLFSGMEPQDRTTLIALLKKIRQLEEN